jgi:hypothetical protein
VRPPLRAEPPEPTLSPHYPGADEPPMNAPTVEGRLSSSGSFAMFAAIRRASLASSPLAGRAPPRNRHGRACPFASRTMKHCRSSLAFQPGRYRRPAPRMLVRVPSLSVTRPYWTPPLDIRREGQGPAAGRYQGLSAVHLFKKGPGRCRVPFLVRVVAGCADAP